MSSALVLLVALVASPATTEVTLDAERVLHDGRLELTTAEGNAQLVSEGLAIDADRIVYDKLQSAATATGHVVARVTQGGLIAVTADVLTVRLDGEEVRELFLLDGKAVSKKGVTPEKLLAAHTADDVRKAGVVAALLTGNHLTRDGSKWTAESIELVPCECNFDEPSWSIRSPAATIDTEADRVSAWSPTVVVHHVPVLWFPWISLPLNDRQTGLLFPKPSITAQNGFGLEQPVYITLGRSADLTLTPGFYTGGDGPYGVQGPRLGTEFRYTPSTHTTGKVTLGLLYNLRPGRDPVDSALTTGAPRGLRYEASWNHLQDFGGGFGARVDASVHSDGYYQRDIVTDIIAREAGYLRSTAVAFHKGDDHLIDLGVVLRQDLQWGYRLIGATPLFQANSGAPIHGPTPLQRLPALELSLPLRPIAGPFAFDLQADYVRIAPLRGLTGDEGVGANEGRAFDANGELEPECLRQRLYLPFNAGSLPTSYLLPTGITPGHLPPGDPGIRETVTASGTRFFLPTPPSDPSIPVGDPGFAVFTRGAATPLLDKVCGVTPEMKAGQGDGVWQPGEREARDRLNLMPRLWASGQPGGVSLAASAAWRQNLWLGEVSGQAAQRGYPLLGARAETELARTFAGGKLRHLIVPSLEVRAVPFVLGDTPAPYDEVNLSVPGPGARVQAVAELRQRLSRRGGPDALRLDLGQGVSLLEPGQSAPRLGESYARLGWQVGWVSGAASVRLDPALVRVTRLSAQLAFDDGAGHGASLGWENLLDDGTNRTRAPMDLLFGTPVSPKALSRAVLVAGGLRYKLGTVQLRYDAMVLNQSFPQPAGDPVIVPALAQQTLGASWAPACDCWRVEVYATHRPQGTNWAVVPDLGATLIVTRFGAIGVSR